MGEPYADSYVSLVCPVLRPDGSAAVLKLQFPEVDSALEAAALRTWGGAGAVRRLAHDQQRLALLMEQCRPGTPLSTQPPDAALAVFIDVMPRLWRPATGPFAAAAEQADRWARDLPGRWLAADRPCERR
ncbi:MAG TPA: aminoglycoside phosphotransferase family protein [Natronosporangium sp.]|nr:aminoglycoside phosphotransferase family protein [Natronosporangium sp.]